MEKQLEEIKKMLEESFPVVEAAQLSQTAYDQESQKQDTLEKEDDKSFEEDKLDLEEILSRDSNFKKNYVKKVVNVVNKLIDGTADIGDLTKVVKGRNKRNK